MLHSAVNTFASQLQVISETIKQRTVQQIKTALAKKAYEEAGIQVQNSSKHIQSGQAAASARDSEVTLNALNARESEADVEGLGDFGSSGQVR